MTDQPTPRAPEPGLVLRQPTEHGYWIHREDESRCGEHIIGRARPSDADWWWCTDHQQHIEWVDDQQPAPEPSAPDDLQDKIAEALRDDFGQGWLDGEGMVEAVTDRVMDVLRREGMVT